MSFLSFVIGLSFIVCLKGYDETTGKIQDIDPAAFVIEAKNDNDVETTYYDASIDK